MEWLKSRHPDPMTHIAGGGASPESHQGVLLLTMKKRAEEFLPLIRPLGVTIPNLFGMRYVTTTNKSVDLLGSTTDHPVIYVCSDPSIALELVKNPPGHIREWLVIADGAKPARTLHASLKTSGDFADTRQCTFAELHDREACRDLIKAGLKPWYLQDLDVEVPPLTPVTPQNSDNLLDRFFTRQHIHWAMTRSVHVVEQPFYENLAHIFHGLLQNLRESGADSDPSLEILGMNVSQFIRKSLAYPLELTSEMRSELKGLASRIFSYSSTLRGFSEAANLICEHFRDVQTEGIPVCNREEKLVELVKTALQKGEKKIAILCCSSHIAEKCDTATHSHPLLRSVEWVNMDGLRRMSPVDRVIIPSRVDRGTMRDVGNNGYGNCVDLVLLPFEAAMFESGRAAGLHWESKLSKHNAARYTQLQTRSGSNSNNRFGLWKTHSPAETEAPPLEETEKDLVGPIVEEDSDFEYLEGQIAEAIKKQTGKISSPDEMVSATLVIFEDVGAFAYLPPKGRVIALSDVADEISFGENPSGQELEGKKAEDMLFRPVSKLHAGLLLAFPLESDRDLLDAWTDKFLENAEETRRISSLWKHALSRHFEKTGESFSAFSQKMAAAGEAREPQTIRSWIKNSQSIAPRNFTVTVPLISKLTEDAELRDNLKKTLDAIQAIYDARAEAAVSIVKKIFSGDINLESELLTIEIEGAVLTYQLQRISVIQETREVPAELVGRVSKLGSVPVDGGLQRDPQP